MPPMHVQEAEYLPLPEGVPAIGFRGMSAGMMGVPGASPGGRGSGQGGSNRPTGTKERFTLSEMYALVEGIERYGLKWAKIHKETPDLENKSQVGGLTQGLCSSVLLPSHSSEYVQKCGTVGLWWEYFPGMPFDDEEDDAVSISIFKLLLNE